MSTHLRLVTDSDLEQRLDEALDSELRRALEELQARIVTEVRREGSDITERINRIVAALDRPRAVESKGVDAYGKDLDLPTYLFTVSGIESLPAHGRAVVTASVWWQRPLLAAAIKRYHAQHREVRPLIDEAVYNLPVLGPLLTRIGCVLACQENAVRMLDEDRVITCAAEFIRYAPGVPVLAARLEGTRFALRPIATGPVQQMIDSIR